MNGKKFCAVRSIATWTGVLTPAQQAAGDDGRCVTVRPLRQDPDPCYIVLITDKPLISHDSGVTVFRCLDTVNHFLQNLGIHSYNVNNRYASPPDFEKGSADCWTLSGGKFRHCQCACGSVACRGA